MEPLKKETLLFFRRYNNNRLRDLALREFYLMQEREETSIEQMALRLGQTVKKMKLLLDIDASWIAVSDDISDICLALGMEPLFGSHALDLKRKKIVGEGMDAP